jgi:very-short-patch-repair endonuclease
MPFYQDQSYGVELSDFQSANERLEVRQLREEEQGDFKPIFDSVPHLFEIWAAAATIAPKCESPIEIELGSRIIAALGVIDDPKLKLIPQYILGPYRYDFAITRDDKLIALIECDGKDFHSTDDQLRNDRDKDHLAAKQDVHMFRFSGSEIVRDGRSCVRKVLYTILHYDHLTREQWDALKLAIEPRPSAI